MCHRRVLLALFMLLALVGAVDRAEAQPINPTVVEFDVNPDHYVSVFGSPIVTRYEVRFYATPTSTTQIGQAVDLGKPSPVNDHVTITSTTLTQALPSGQYAARIVAVGPGGEAASDGLPFGRITAPSRPTAGVVR